MTESDWASIRIPVLMAQTIDRWLQTDIAKKNGIFSRSDLVKMVLSTWFVNFEKDFGIFVPREIRRNLKGFDVMKPLES